MKKSILQNTMICLLLSTPIVALSATDEELNKKLETLEQRLQIVEQEKVDASIRQSTSQTTNNGFNPAISVILDGVFASYKNNPEAYALSGYALGGEAGLAPEGFSLGHSEISLSNNIDDKFFGQFTLAIGEHDGSTEVELEEAFSKHWHWVMDFLFVAAVFIPESVISTSNMNMPGIFRMRR